MTAALRCRSRCGDPLRSYCKTGCRRTNEQPINSPVNRESTKRAGRWDGWRALPRWQRIRSGNLTRLLCVWQACASHIYTRVERTIAECCRTATFEGRDPRVSGPRQAVPPRPRTSIKLVRKADRDPRPKRVGLQKGSGYHLGPALFDRIRILRYRSNKPDGCPDRRRARASVRARRYSKRRLSS